MLIPEKDKEVRTIRIPGLIFRSLAFLFVIAIILFGILSYDYYKIYQQIYENKHLNLENKQLKEQIQLFQMKINTLTNDIKRIHTFEKKLRVITGLEDHNKRRPTIPDDSRKGKSGIGTGGNDIDMPRVNSDQGSINNKSFFEIDIDKSLDFSKMVDDQKYTDLKNLYDKKIAINLGLENAYTLAKSWTDLAQRSFSLSEVYASFDYQYSKIKGIFSQIEVDIHELDQFLLDKESFLKSTPTILPTNGWITSYFGRRHSPLSGKLKMHEGIDVGANFGNPVRASADGIVTYSGIKPGFGHFVQIEHGYGVETLYAHSSKLHVSNGQKVKRGELIASIGSSGYSTGPHLHYEVRINGIAVDPLYFVLD
jgi:murein DD-endopeptidase MepM/ murein hydrolase activator NlpD